MSGTDGDHSRLTISQLKVYNSYDQGPVAMGEWGPHSHKHKLNMTDFILNMPSPFFARVFGNPVGDPVLLKSRGVTLLRDRPSSHIFHHVPSSLFAFFSFSSLLVLTRWETVNWSKGRHNLGLSSLQKLKKFQVSNIQPISESKFLVQCILIVNYIYCGSGQLESFCPFRHYRLLSC